MLLERLLALATGAIVAICLGFGLLMMAGGPARKGAEQAASEADAVIAAPPPAAPEAPSERASVEAVIASAPEYARFFERLRQTFPGDYERVLDSFAAVDRPGEKSEASADYYLSETVRRLRQSRGVLAAKAETGPLGKVFDLQLEVLRAISTQDKRLCVAFLYGGVDSEFHSFAAGRRALVAEMATAGLDAISSGQTSKVERSPPTDADFRALENALVAKGLGKAEIEALLDGKTPDPPLDDARMCAAGLSYLEVLRALPEPARFRIYGLAVELMARS